MGKSMPDRPPYHDMLPAIRGHSRAIAAENVVRVSISIATSMAFEAC